MKTIAGTIPVLLAAAGLLLLSFTPKPGGEGFEIFLNNKLLLAQFNNEMNTTKTFSLPPDASGQLSIKYHHCGRVGKSRSITIKDEQDRILKQWNFADASTPSASMLCDVKDILSLKKGRNSTLKLYYSSSELPGGRQLAAIRTGVVERVR